jgi:hypothetical protein
MKRAILEAAISIPTESDKPLDLAYRGISDPNEDNKTMDN